jgi:hypothetical protein
MQTDDCEKDRGRGRYLDSRHIRDARGRHASPCQVELTAAPPIFWTGMLSTGVHLSGHAEKVKAVISCRLRLSGGCHLNRKMDYLIEAGGFGIGEIRSGYMKGPRPMAFMQQGYAVPRSERRGGVLRAG